jgi:hypothetical protein
MKKNLYILIKMTIIILGVGIISIPLITVYSDYSVLIRLVRGMVQLFIVFGFVRKLTYNTM